MEGLQLNENTSQVSVWIPPFIHFLAEKCRMRLRKALAALMVNITFDRDLANEYTEQLGYKLNPDDGDLDFNFYHTTLVELMKDINMIRNQKDCFSGFHAYITFVAATHETYVQLKKELASWRELRPKYKAELTRKEPRLRDLRPSYVWPLDVSDLLDDGDDFDDDSFDEGTSDDSNPPIKGFKQHWPQFLRHNAPGVEGALGGSQESWYVSGHLIPHVGLRILERWDDEWRRSLDALGPNDTNGTSTYKPPSWRKAQGVIDTSSSGAFVRVSQRHGQDPEHPVPYSGLSKSLLNSEATGDLAYFNRLLSNLEPQPTDRPADQSWESLAIFTAYNKEKDHIDWRDLD